MDENLEPLYLSLPQFVSRAHGLSLASEDAFKFLRFVLAGRLKDDDGKEHRIFVNTRQGIKPPTKDKYTVSRDIDSIIGVSSDLPYKSSLAIFPMPSFRDTLTEDIHKKYTLKDGFPDAFGAPLHKIPNFAFGTVDRRHITVICFPRMYKVGACPKILPEDISLFYNTCLRPSFVSISGHDTSRMHPTYAMLNDVNHDKRGRLHFSTVDLQAKLLDKFTQELRQQLDKHDKFRDAYFVHQFKGLKGRYRHEPEDSNQRRDAMQDFFLDHLQEDKLDPDQWMFDIALEIRDPGRILQWLTAGHNAILCHLLPSASNEKVEQLIKSQNYKCDITAQLEAVGGFRAVPFIRENPDKISYINIYTTDKSVTYQYHEGLYRRRKAWHLFPGDIGKLTLDMKKISDTFSRCRGESGLEAFEGSVRMEIRIPLNKVAEALKDIPHALISKTVLSFDCDTLWGFKYYRALALYRIIKGLQQTAPEVRLQGASLATGAIAIHMENSLIYRPAEGKAENALLDLACYHDPEEVETQPSVYQPGAYFVSDIQKGLPHQLPETCVLEAEYLLRLYRRDSMADIAHEFRDKEDGEGRRMGRCRKKRKLTALIVPVGVAEDLDESSDSASSASSAGWNGVVEENEGNMMEGVVSPIVDLVVRHDESEIFQQFPSCIAQLVPDSRKGSDPWVLSSTAGTKHASMDLFMGRQNINANIAEQALIGRVFLRCQYKVVNSIEWEETIFERYFPPKGFSPPKQFQHFGRSQYYTMWTDFMKKTNTQDAIKLRKQAYLWFKELRWVPYPESDRIWCRKAAKAAGWYVLPVGGAPDGPRLAFNGTHWKGSAANFSN